MQLERRATALATVVSALVGSGLFVLLAFDWPRPIIDWMRVIVVRGDYPPPNELALKVAVIFAVAALLFAIAIAATRWSLQRLKLTQPAIILAVVLAFFFILSFALEATSQVVRARGNLTASDATGLMIDEMRLTLHGWGTIARRAAVASLYAGLMAAAFAVARRSFIKGGGNP